VIGTGRVGRLEAGRRARLPRGLLLDPHARLGGSPLGARELLRSPQLLITSGRRK
jgi:hypothetical protein